MADRDDSDNSLDPDIGCSWATAFAARHSLCIGAEIMGANKFGPLGWLGDPDWQGWWGPNPPFHTPTFVLTHRPRPSMMPTIVEASFFVIALRRTSW